MTETRAVCLNCIDGRVQLPSIQWIKRKFKVDNVDVITEPGMDGLLADPSNSIEAIIQKIQISIRINKASFIFVAGHYDCRGNPVNESIHRKQILLSTKRLEKKFEKMDVIGIWINKEWQSEQL